MTPRRPGQDGYHHWWHRVATDVLREGDVSREAQLLVLALLNYANLTGVCNVKPATLADDLGVSERTIARYASELEGVKLIRRVGGYRGRHTEYLLYVPEQLPQRTLDRLAKTSATVKQRPATKAPVRPAPASETAATGEPAQPALPPQPSRRDTAATQRAERWLNDVLLELPSGVRVEFDEAWNTLKAADPGARERALDVVAGVFARDETGLLADKVAQQVLHPEGDPSGGWGSAEDIARVFLRRLHRAAREVSASSRGIFAVADVVASVADKISVA